MSQIALPLVFDKQFSFDNFISERGEFVIASLKSLIEGGGETMLGLWGGADCGKTHLLNASAYFARQQQLDFQLYDGLQLAQCDARDFDYSCSGGVLAIDNLDALCHHRDWEEKFYQIFNHCKLEKLNLIFTLSSNPQHLDFSLVDLQSRLSWGLLLQLPALSDQDLEGIVRARARLLGLELSNEVLAYLLTHFARSISTQVSILTILDKASLTAQKKISIPLIKQALAQPGAVPGP